jgi:hypothetical protein
MLVSIFPTTPCRNVFHFSQTERDMIKICIGFRVNKDNFCMILTELEFSRQTLEKCLNNKFHKNASNCIEAAV